MVESRHSDGVGAPTKVGAEVCIVGDHVPAQSSAARVDAFGADASDSRHAHRSPPARTQEAACDDSSVFTAGVPISAVPDDGEWSIDSPVEARDIVVPIVDHSSKDVSLSPAADLVDTDLPVTVALKAAEAFEPDTCEHGEMPMAVGDTAHTFDALEEKGWVYGYKVDAHGAEVIAQGWVPAALLVPLDVDIDVSVDNWCGRSSGRRKGDTCEKESAALSESAACTVKGTGRGRSGRGRGKSEYSVSDGDRDAEDDHSLRESKAERKGGKSGSNNGSKRGGRGVDRGR